MASLEANFLNLRDRLRRRAALGVVGVMAVVMLGFAPLSFELGLEAAAQMALLAGCVSLLLLALMWFSSARWATTLGFGTFVVMIFPAMIYTERHGYPIHNWAYLFPPMVVFLLKPRVAAVAMVGFGVFTTLLNGHLLSTLELVRFMAIYGLLAGFVTTFALLEETAGVALARETDDAQQLRHLLEASLDAVIAMDADGRVTAWSAAAERIFGWPAEAIIGHRLGDHIIPHRYREAHEAGMRRFLANGDSRVLGKTLELAALRRDGTEIPVEISIWQVAGAERPLFGALIRDISARKTAENALLVQESRFRSVVENGSEGIVVAADGRIIYVNPYILQMLGRTADSLLGQPFTGFIHPDDVQRVVNNYRRRLSGEAVEQHYEFRVAAADGRTVWVSLSAVAITWDGAPATLSFLTDVTQRRKLQEQLRDSYAEHEAMLANSIIGLIFMDPERRIRWVNNAVLEIFGGDQVEAIGDTTERFYPDKAEYQRRGAESMAAFAKGLPYEAELQLKRGNGDVFWAYVTGRTIVVEGVVKGVIWSILDISGRRKLEDALRTKTQEQEAILQSTIIGIGVIRAQRLDWANRTLEQMFRYPEGALQGRSVAPLFRTTEEMAALLPVVMQRIDGEGTFDVELELVRADGTPIWVQVHGALLGYENDVRSSLWTFFDITERKRAETELLNALAREREFSQLKNRFVSMTSHEFRTPLAGILSSVDLVDQYRDRLGKQETDEVFTQIREAVARMTRMLDNILLIGRGEADILRLSTMPTDIPALCRELSNEATQSRASDDSRPDVLLHLDGVDGMWDVDPNLLRHILGNLLSNAVKYSPDGGDVRFDVHAEDGMLRFEVADQGIGIPEEDQARLFQSFHRAGNVGNIAGSGLGLAIVKQAANLHGGTVEVRSGRGDGTLFTVRIPARPVA